MKIIVDLEAPLYGTLAYFQKYVVPALNIHRSIKGLQPMDEQEQIDYFLDKYNERARQNKRPNNSYPAAGRRVQ